MENKTKLSVRDMAYIAMFAVVMAVCSWISVPYVVPFTLQTFGVFLAVGVLGGKRGTLAVLIYILLGCVGLPVFAGFSGGIGIVLGRYRLMQELDGSLRLQNLPPHIRKVLRLAGVDALKIMDKGGREE